MNFNHMFLNEELADNISMSFYEAGHMMYIHQPSLIKMKQTLDQFIDETLSGS